MLLQQVQLRKTGTTQGMCSGIQKGYWEFTRANGHLCSARTRVRDGKGSQGLCVQVNTCDTGALRRASLPSLHSGHSTVARSRGRVQVEAADSRDMCAVLSKGY